MKVLIVTNMYPSATKPYYGIFVKEQIDAISKLNKSVKFDIYDICDGSSNGKRLCKLYGYIKSIWEINRLIKMREYDLVHIHYGLSGLFLLNPFRKKIPSILTLHGGDIQAEQKKKVQVYLTKLILSKSDMAITLNARMDTIARQFIAKTQIIPCGVDTDFFVPISSSPPIDKVKIVFPSSRDRYVKNYSLFENVINLLKEKYAIDCVSFEIDNMTRFQVRDLYQSANMMLMTSISEGSPQVVKEAMACNLPVISTPVGDVRVLLENVNGSAVADEHDAEELARLCIESLLGNLKGVNGREKIFSMGVDSRSVALLVYDAYKKLIS